MSTKMCLILDIEYEGPDTVETLKDRLWRLAFRCADTGLMSNGLTSTVKKWEGRAVEVGCACFDSCGTERSCFCCPHNTNYREKKDE